MEEQVTKTSTKQRIIIGLIAVFMFFSTIGVYALVVLNGELGERTAAENEAKLEEYGNQLTELSKELADYENKFSAEYYDTFSKYRSNVKSFNATTANNSGLITSDLVEGNGTELKEGSEYAAYYIGWCPDETVFDSSFDDYENPTSISPLVAASDSSFIAGWTEGVIGMKVGGIRQIEIPGELAYGDSEEPCGAANSPLKFIVYVIDPGSEYNEKIAEYNKVRNDYLALYYSTNSVNSI